jgi:ketosteroid isomerase-like protein
MGEMLSMASAVALTVTPVQVIESDRIAVSELDIAYQAAAKRNDADVMDAILHPDFVLVRGDGTVISREAIINAARNQDVIYSVQDELPGTQTVRVWGDTAVVTALLHIVGESGETKIDKKIWFSDTYVRTDTGWRYAFAQVSLPLPTG